MPLIAWVVLGACLVLVWVNPGFGDPILARMERAFSEFAQHRRLAIVAIGALTILARVSLLPWQPVPQPKIHDEFSYLLAADTFAHGRLANPPHPLWIFFDTFHVIQHPTYASMYPPAQGMVLAVGKLLGQPWIAVLLSVSAMCMAFTWMLQAWVPPEWALLGGVLVWARFGIFSYWINSFWGGAVAATGAALVLGALARIWNDQRPRDAIIFGLGAAILAVSRPVEGAVFFLPFGVALLWWALRDARSRTAAMRRLVLPVAAILACVAAFVGFYNSRVTGSPFVFPHFIEQREITTAVFLWQHDKPPIAYSNPQFDDFYHNFLPSLYQASWPSALGQLRYKATDFWEFFLGPALCIPFLALPWLLKEPRNRLLLVQAALSALALWIIVYYHAHYAAPLMATVFVLLMQCMRSLRRFRVLGSAIGVGLTRLIVLFSLFLGPVYFVQAELSKPSPLFVWLHHHALWPLGGALFALLLLKMASWLASRRGAPVRRAWLPATCEFVLVIMMVLPLCEIQRNLYADAFPYLDGLSEPFRKPVEAQLAVLPGDHLILVRYSKDHDSGEEYVYNDADIDRAKTIWAREIPGMDLGPLFKYFRNRDVWLYEPDEDDSTVTPYAPPHEQPQ